CCSSKWSPDIPQGMRGGVHSGGIGAGAGRSDMSPAAWEDAVMTRNSTTVWGWPAILLHWIGAVLILVLLVHGAWMLHFAPRPERAVNYAWHAALGYDFLGLLVLRLLWRWMNPVPALPGDLKPWERYAANTGHIGLYLL